MAGRFSAEELFARHLDLALLQGRRRGKVRCRFHDGDRSPSLSLDLDRGLFHCFACGAQGGVRGFAQLVGEVPVRPEAPVRLRTDWEVAWGRALQLARTEGCRGGQWALWMSANDFVRRTVSAAAEARTLAVRLGPDDPRAWPLLERAARVEREGLAAEAELADLLAEGRIYAVGPVCDASERVSPGTFPETSRRPSTSQRRAFPRHRSSHQIITVDVR
jgi:CHC2-type zinc finger protein